MFKVMASHGFIFFNPHCDHRGRFKVIQDRSELLRDTDGKESRARKGTAVVVTRITNPREEAAEQRCHKRVSIGDEGEGS